ncbi:ERAD-associated E3 ubiquitin-protein ligase DOA10 [Spathaspora sp. JA1]|nr:ERAD-associated E3 ubiquitin-protein ligase DOA10 [Spathaspora sp. JA1]
MSDPSKHQVTQPPVTSTHLPTPLKPITPNTTSTSINISKRPMITQTLPPITQTKRKRKKQRLFTKDIENLLYAMGDRPVSTDSTVSALEDILVEYLSDLSSQILTFSRSQGRSRIKMNDLAFALRNDPLKLARFQYIIEQSHKIERAKKMFEDKTMNYSDDEKEGSDEDNDIGNDERTREVEAGEEERTTGTSKFIGRAYTWVLDGSLPPQNQKFLNALLFGEYDIEGYLTSFPNLTPVQIRLFTVRKFFTYTYFSGIRFIIVFIIVHIALYIEREWIVRDEGYLKLLMRKIGKERKTMLAEILQETLAQLRNEGNPEPDMQAAIQRVERAIDDLQQNNPGLMNNNRQRALRRAIEDGIMDIQNPEADAPHEPLQVQVEQEEHNPEQENIDIDRVRAVEDDSDHSEGEHELHQPALGRLGQGEDLADENMRHFLNEFVRDHPNVQDENDETDSDAENEEVNNVQQEEEPQQVDIGDVEQDILEADGLAPAGDDQDGALLDILEVFGAHLDIKTPFMYMAIINIVNVVYLFVIYFIPHLLGNVVSAVIGISVRFLNSKIFSRIYAFVVSNEKVNLFLENKMDNLKTGHEVFQFAFLTLKDYVIDPVFSTLCNIFSFNVGSSYVHYSLVERIVILCIGYSVIGGVIYKIMNFLADGPRPLVGAIRKAYKILFEVSSTAKVFLIFAIEIFFFPVYCGWLLDFCFAPLILPAFTVANAPKPQYIVLITSYAQVLQEPYLRICLYWTSGTLYMLFFALFVGMVRSTILRPGVLFFIRSPDDPNTRLIHDALMKPLPLQLSRIYLSAKVYTGFVLVGIGGVTWGLRYVVSTPEGVDYNVFLPIQIPSLTTVCFVVFFATSATESSVLVTKYVKKYWNRAFELSAHKLRLSHFILGKPISHERGHVVYRNLWHQLLGSAQPDYSKPVSYKEALESFKANPLLNACFVPDGNYVRAPDNDTVSRKFIRKLFVSVTKDDKLLEVPNDTKPKKSGYETPSSDEEDEEFTGENAYTIVYRPPHFRLRCFGFIFLLWIFAVILILSCAIVAVLIGRPIIRAKSYLFKSIPLLNQGADLDWRLVDFSSIVLGIYLEVRLLKLYDKWWAPDSPQGGINEINVEQLARADGDAEEAQPEDDNLAPQQRLFRAIFNFGGVFNRLPKSLLLTAPSVFIWATWMVSIHSKVVTEPVRYITGRYEQDLLFDPPTVVLNFIVSFWTILPLLYYLKPIPQQLNLYQSLWKCGLLPCLINFLLVHLPARLIISTSRYYGKSSKSLEVFVWPAMFVVLVAIKIIHGGRDLYVTLNDQVKKEKYVRGRAIENIDSRDS